jgi:hypothetical protein
VKASLELNDFHELDHETWSALGDLKNMGLNFVFGKKSKMGKLMRTYVKNRVKKKRAFDEQLERLDAQLQNEGIDQYTYERLRDVLAINYAKQREEAREQLSFFRR